MTWWIAIALADPTDDKSAKPTDRSKSTVVIEVVPTIVEGLVRIGMPGREGDKLFIDEWYAGQLPLETTLAEGPHRFRVESGTKKQEIEAYIVPVLGKTVEIDLTNPPKQQDAAASEPIPTP